MFELSTAHSFVVRALVMTMAFAASESQSWARAETPPPAPPPAAVPTGSQVSQILNQGFAEFAAVQTAMSARRWGEAMNQAKALLDRVKVATGIDPNVQLVQAIRVRGAFGPDALGRSLGELVFPVQESVKRAVRDHQGGLYVDLINLTKRAYVQWVAAQFFRIRADGNLFSTDRRHLMGNLGRAYHYAIYVQDEFVPQGPLMISDKEVVDPDKGRYFDRELEALVQGLPELGWTVDGFLAESERLWQERLAQHRSSVSAGRSGRARGIEY